MSDPVGFGLIAVLVSLVLFVFVIVGMNAHETGEMRKACEKRGGVLVVDRHSERVCVAVLRANEP
jgi:hypothetical protein